MNIISTVLLGGLALVAITLAYVRYAPSSAARWHVDPTTAARPKTPNYYFVLPSIAKRPAPIYQTSATDLAAAFDAFAMTQPQVERLAGSVDDLYITYIQRTKTMKYPDYLSVRFIDLDDGQATVAVFSRARFGIGDKGFNKRRVLKWLTALDGFPIVTASGQGG